MRKASNIIDNILNGKPLVKDSEETASCTQVIGVVKEILDRQYPKITMNQNMSINVDLSPVDLDKYRLDRG